MLIVLVFKFKFKFKILYYLFIEIYPWCHRITENSSFYKKTTIKKHTY